MLVLSRKTSQRIRIGNEIVLTVVKIGGNVVRLGIEAPPEMAVLREELLPSRTQTSDSTPLARATLPPFSRQQVFDKNVRRGYLPA